MSGREGPARLPEHADLAALAARVRLNAAEMVAIQGLGYLGQAMSAAEIFAVLFGGGFVRSGRDRFVLSPGHYAIALYAVAVEVGLIERRHLDAYGADGALLEAISTERTPVVDLTCGSLGQGLSGAIGLALAARFAKKDGHTYAFLSDGEMEEGQVWEAAMFASHHKLDRLVAIVDANGSQVDGPVTSVTTLEPLAEKWRAFGWDVADIDGHDIPALVSALGRSAPDGRPRVVIGRTSMLGCVRSLPATVDPHWITLDPDVRKALIAELKIAGA